MNVNLNGRRQWPPLPPAGIHGHGRRERNEQTILPLERREITDQVIQAREPTFPSLEDDGQRHMPMAVQLRNAQKARDKYRRQYAEVVQSGLVRIQPKPSANANGNGNDVRGMEDTRQRAVVVDEQRVNGRIPGGEPRVVLDQEWLREVTQALGPDAVQQLNLWYHRTNQDDGSGPAVGDNGAASPRNAEGAASRQGQQRNGWVRMQG